MFGVTAQIILTDSANPGLISHFTKKGLEDIAKKFVRDKSVAKKDIKEVEDLLRERDFGRLSMKLGVKTIHCSERESEPFNGKTI